MLESDDDESYSGESGHVKYRFLDGFLGVLWACVWLLVDVLGGGRCCS